MLFILSSFIYVDLQFLPRSEFIKDQLFLGSLVLAQSRILFTVAGQFSIVGQCGKMYCMYAEELMKN